MARYVVDYLRPADLDAVHEIDLASFPIPWQRETYLNELRAGHEHRYVAARFVAVPLVTTVADSSPPSLSERMRRWARGVQPPPGVPQHDLPVVGHAGICREGKTGHIATLAVHPGHRGQGVGTLLLLALIEEARALRVKRLALEVRTSNLPAQQLYRRFGFTVTGTQSGYYRDNDEDAYLLAIDDLDALPVREHHKRLSDRLYVRLQHENAPPGTDAAVHDGA